MSNSFSPPKLPLSQEIENPSSFNISILFLEESSCIPVCGVASPTLLASPVPNPREILPCSPTLVLSGKDSQNFESQSVVKPTSEILGLEVVSQPRHVSSTISERLLEGDLPDGKSVESNVLADHRNKSLASLRGDTHPTLLEQEYRSPELVPRSVQPVFDQTLVTMGVRSEEEDEEETHIVWSRKGVRGANMSTMAVSDLVTNKVSPKTRLKDEPTESERKIKRKGKGKMVESSTKGDKRSDTESNDIVKGVVKRKKEAREKSPVKRDRVTKKSTSKPKSGKEPGPTAQKQVEGRVLNGRVFDPDILREHGMSTLFYYVSLQSWEHLFEGPAPYLQEPEVWEFYYKMELLGDEGIQTTVRTVKISLNGESLGIILGIPSIGIRSIEGCKPSSDFIQRATKRGDIKRVGLPKKFLKREYQLTFEFINKVLVPRSEKRIVASAADLFLME
ncbi:hypothetical protein H5410_061963, partial [Solanum commersonii]